MQDCLRPGMRVAACYDLDIGGEDLHSQVQSALSLILDDPSAVLVQQSLGSSTVMMNITVLQDLAGVARLDRIIAELHRLVAPSAVFVKQSAGSVYELKSKHNKKKGGA